MGRSIYGNRHGNSMSVLAVIWNLWIYNVKYNILWCFWQMKKRSKPSSTTADESDSEPSQKNIGGTNIDSISADPDHNGEYICQLWRNSNAMSVQGCSMYLIHSCLQCTIYITRYSLHDIHDILCGIFLICPNWHLAKPLYWFSHSKSILILHHVQHRWQI